MEPPLLFWLEYAGYAAHAEPTIRIYVVTQPWNFPFLIGCSLMLSESLTTSKIILVWIEFLSPWDFNYNWRDKLERCECTLNLCVFELKYVTRCKGPFFYCHEECHFIWLSRRVSFYLTLSFQCNFVMWNDSVKWNDTLRDSRKMDPRTKQNPLKLVGCHCLRLIFYHSKSHLTRIHF